MNCQNCNTELAENAKFCLECGTKVNSVLKCSCGAEYKAGTKFCSECGNNLAATATTPATATANNASANNKAQEYYEKAQEHLKWAKEYFADKKHEWLGKENLAKAIENFTKAIELRDRPDADDYFSRGLAYKIKTITTMLLKISQSALKY